MDSGSNMWWMGPLVFTALRILQTEARITHAQIQGHAIVFRVPLSMRVLFASFIIGITCLVVMSIRREEAWLLVLGEAVVMAACLAWPPTITLTDQAIQRSLWWRPMVTLRWEDVIGVEKDIGGDLHVFGKQRQQQIENFAQYRNLSFHGQLEMYSLRFLQGCQNA